MAGGHVWQGGMHDRGGMCGVGGMHGRGECAWGGGMWQGGICDMHTPRQILRLRHTVNERAVCILLECILV